MATCYLSLWLYAPCTACYLSNILPSSPGSIQSILEKWKSACGSIFEAYPHFWLSCLCPTVSSCYWQVHSKMGCQGKIGSISLTIIKACMISCFSFKCNIMSYLIISLKLPDITELRYNCHQHGNNWPDLTIMTGLGRLLSSLKWQNSTLKLPPVEIETACKNDAVVSVEDDLP